MNLGDILKLFKPGSKIGDNYTFLSAKREGVEVYCRLHDHVVLCSDRNLGYDEAKRSVYCNLHCGPKSVQLHMTSPSIRKMPSPAQIKSKLKSLKSMLVRTYASERPGECIVGDLAFVCSNDDVILVRDSFGKVRRLVYDDVKDAGKPKKRRFDKRFAQKDEGEEGES